MNNNKIVSINNSNFSDFIKTLKLEKYYLIELDGLKINDKNDLFLCFDKIIGFPEYFGKNWDAFTDTINDIYYVKKDMIIFIKNYDKLLINNSKDRIIFIDTLLDLINNTYLNTSIQVFIIK